MYSERQKSQNVFKNFLHFEIAGADDDKFHKDDYIEKHFKRMICVLLEIDVVDI